MINHDKYVILAIIELVRELAISNMQNKFEQDTWKTWQIIVPTRKC